MSEIVFLIEEAAEGGFSARALGESIFTQADTFEELREQVRDAVRCHFDEGQGPADYDLEQAHRAIGTAIERVERIAA